MDYISKKEKEAAKRSLVKAKSQCRKVIYGSEAG